MALSERLRKLRKEQGLSQEAVARRADIGLRAYGELERGIAKDPHLTTLEGIASALGTTVAELVGEEPEVPAPKDQAPQESGQLRARSQPRPRSAAKPHLFWRGSWEEFKNLTPGEQEEFFQNVEKGRATFGLEVLQDLAEGAISVEEAAERLHIAGYLA